MNLTGIVLAGGKSRRMGRDKAFIQFKGKRLIEYSLELLKGFCDEIIISANDTKYQKFGYTVIRDEFIDAGPAAGIATGLVISKNEWNFVLSCDNPYLNKESLQYLLSFKGAGVGTVAFHDGKTEPLIGLYHKSFEKDLIENIRRGNYKLQDIIRESDIQRADFSQLLSSFPDIFHNVNFPQDL